MVIIQDYKVVTTEEGDTYIRLILSGGISMVRSKGTGNFYATNRRCSISATFDEEIAKQMIGTQMPGSIVKIECEPYMYETDKGEVLELSHRWTYTDKSGEQLAVDELVDSVNSNGTTQELNQAA
jgi:hypothetical protein